MKLDDLGSWITLTVVFLLVLGVLNLLIRFRTDCRRDVDAANQRISWPTATVEATLFDATLRARRVDRPPSVIGHYAFEFEGVRHTVERYEPFSGDREEQTRNAESLKREGKTIELQIQYNPEDPAEAYTELVTEIPGCTWWINGFLALFGVFLLLILRGYYRLFTG